MSYYQRHFFFCINQRDNKRCCGEKAIDYCLYAKQKLKEAGLHRAGMYRVSHSGCLGRCEQGPLLVIYPEGIWYSYQTHRDIDEIIEQHVLKGKIVKRLQLPELVLENKSE